MVALLRERGVELIGPDEGGAGPRWYAVRTRSRHEKRVHAQLADRPGPVGEAIEDRLPGRIPQRRCTGCQLGIDNAELAVIAASPSDLVIRCEECSRILVRTPESGL